MQKLNTNQTKQTTYKTAKINYPGSVASYDTRPGNEVGLFYNDNRHGPRNPHRAQIQRKRAVNFQKNLFIDIAGRKSGEKRGSWGLPRVLPRGSRRRPRQDTGNR